MYFRQTFSFNPEVFYFDTHASRSTSDQTSNKFVV